MEVKSNLVEMNVLKVIIGGGLPVVKKAALAVT
jgi:hypothetical protein